ncbi:uncharacterized protein LOC143432078 [Xylocopa sonorina]|uniref:uncharacterized protein LOC143432078 n=1 Tax=Xylocopa sonorina TaxID=1818115 RepID=UPI00403B2150
MLPLYDGASAASANLKLLNHGNASTCVCQQGESKVNLSFANGATARRVKKISVSKIQERRTATKNQNKWSLRSMDDDLFMAATLAATWPDEPTEEAVVESEAEWFTRTLTSACNVSMPKLKSNPPRNPVYWWSDEISRLRADTTIAWRNFTRYRKRRNSIPERREQLYQIYKERKIELQAAIKKSKARAWDGLLETLREDPWGRPYKIVMNKLRPWTPPLTEIMETSFLEGVVDTLFPSEDPTSATNNDNSIITSSNSRINDPNT